MTQQNRGGSSSNRGGGSGRGGVPPVTSVSPPPKRGVPSLIRTGVNKPNQSGNSTTPAITPSTNAQQKRGPGAITTQDPSATVISNLPAPPPPVKKRKFVSGPTTPAGELLNIASGNVNYQDVMAKAIPIVEGCVASVAADGIGPVSDLFNALWTDDLTDVLMPDERRQLLQALIAALFRSKQIDVLVERDEGFFREVLAKLTESGDLMKPAYAGQPERYELAGILIDNLFTNALDSLKAQGRVDFVAFLLKTASFLVTQQGLAAKPAPEKFVTLKLPALGMYAVPVAAALVDGHWGTWPGELGAPLVKWIFENMPLDQWTVPDKERAARGLNLLWTVDDYGRIGALIENGVDCTASGKAWGVKAREGVHSGYIQPLTHVLGKYMKFLPPVVQKLPEGIESHKVDGAWVVVQAIGRSPKPPKILFDYGKITSSQLVVAFDTGSGMIWGFEDIRLPYILAARERTNGKRTLRMLDMWPAVGKVTDPKNYQELIANPDQKIAEVIEAGVKEIITEMKEGKLRYNGLDTDKDKDTFIDNFKTECEQFLRFFANQRPYGAYQATAKASGKDQEKRLSTYACIMGLYWSASKNLPVYYCLDGLDPNDVVTYKRYKIKEIDGYLRALDTPATQLLNHTPFTDVVSLAELREIIRYWGDPKRGNFQNVVRFVEQGQVMTAEESGNLALKWQFDLKISEEGQRRKPLPKTSFEDEAIALQDDRPFWNGLSTDVRWKCVKEGDRIKLAANNPERFDLLLRVLIEDCPTLKAQNLVPEKFVQLLIAANAASADQPVSAEALANLREAMNYVCKGLYPLLEAAVNRRFGPPPPSGPPQIIIGSSPDSIKT
jgi:hypothetical protein